MELIYDEAKEMFSRNKQNANIIRVGDNILTAAA